MKSCEFQLKMRPQLVFDNGVRTLLVFQREGQR